MEKIDFFGGTHGNFLELIINLFIYQLEIPDHEFFNSNGACHLKQNISTYIPKIKCNHYSYNNIPFDINDSVIEIRCQEKDMLIALTNSLLRAGDQVIDITNLEKNTIEKLYNLPKASKLLNDLVIEHGKHTDYSRSTIRNYFYSKFDNPDFGLRQFDTFQHQGPTLTFPFDAFFNLEDFFLNLNKCAFFLNLNFYPNNQLVEIWKKFMKVNQGYQSHQRCNRAMQCILTGESMDISDFNLVEEAWILYRLSCMFRCYNHPLLNVDQFVPDTKEISYITYKWKKGDYPSRP